MHYSAQDSKCDSRPQQPTAVPTPRCPDILVMCAAMTQHLWSMAFPLAGFSTYPLPITVRLLESAGSISSSPVSKWDGVEMHVLIHAQRILGKRTEPHSCCFSSQADPRPADRPQATCWLTNYIEAPSSTFSSSSTQEKVIYQLRRGGSDADDLFDIWTSRALLTRDLSPTPDRRDPVERRCWWLTSRWIN